MRRELRLSEPLFRSQVGALIREARLLVGWSQAELANRAGTSQSRVSRLEVGDTDDVEVALIARLLAALGHRGTFIVEDRHLDDRREQRGLVHGVLLGYVAARLTRLGWRTATEVRIGDGAPRGWIDLLAHRQADNAGLMCEVKGDLPDVGGLQRQVTFYEREAPAAMRRLGWHPRGVATLVVALDTAAVHGVLRAHADLLGPDFPGSPPSTAAWLQSAGGQGPPRTIGLADPLARHEDWLRRTPMSGRRSSPAYASYADGASKIAGRPRPARRPR